MTYSKGKIPGTLVKDEWLEGEGPRQYMVDRYGGRLVAEGMSNADIDNILKMQEKLKNLQLIADSVKS